MLEIGQNRGKFTIRSYFAFVHPGISKMQEGCVFPDPELSEPVASCKNLPNLGIHDRDVLAYSKPKKLKLSRFLVVGPNPE